MFVSVDISPTFLHDTDSNNVVLTIHLKERWYIFPLPIIELADRNVNVWRTQHNLSLKRLELGVKFDHDNFLGRNQKLSIVLQGGFTKKYEIFHTLPYINKKKTLGLSYGLSYSTNKSVGYTQEDNLLLFHRSENILRKRFYGGLSLKFRPKFYISQELGVYFHHNRIHEELLDLTNFYLGEGMNTQRYFRLFYIFSLNKTDINYYPTKGYEFNVKLAKTGLWLINEVNHSVQKIEFSKYFTLNKKLFAGTRLSLRNATPKIFAYNLQNGLGYEEDFVRGYEPFVIDGQQYALNRNEFKFKAWSVTKNWGKLIPIKEFRTVPYTFYLKLFSDVAYVNNHDQRINSSYQNRLIHGHGVGLDIVSYYDLVLRFEYAVNDNLKSGFYFHFEKGI